MRSDWLAAFAQFSETMNFTIAAKAMHISQPALHVKIKQLQDYIGEPLYKKEGRNLILTSTGEKLRIFAIAQQSQIKNFVTELKLNNKIKAIELAAGEGALLYLLGDGIAYAKKNLENQINIHVKNSRDAIDAVIHYEADIAISTIRHQSADIKAKQLTSVGQVLVLPVSHPLAKKKTISLKDLDNQKLIVPPHGKTHRTNIATLLQEHSIDWSVAAEVNSWEVMIRLVGLEVGISIVNECCNIPISLTAKPLREFSKIDYYLIYRDSALSNPVLKAFIEALLIFKDKWKKNT